PGGRAAAGRGVVPGPRSIRCFDAPRARLSRRPAQSGRTPRLRTRKDFRPMRRPHPGPLADDARAAQRPEAVEQEIRVLQARPVALTEQVSRNDSLLRKTQEREDELLLPGAASAGGLARIPLRRNEPFDGVLVFSSADPLRFTQELASNFLAHLGLVAALCIENAVNRARLLRSGLTDFLTGFHNRRYLHARLREELARAQRARHSLVCLMIDVDHFKRINDQYGHLAGDAVLRE